MLIVCGVIGLVGSVGSFSLLLIGVGANEMPEAIHYKPMMMYSYQRR